MERFQKIAERVCVVLIALLFAGWVAGTIYSFFDTQFYCDWTGYRYPHLNCAPRGQS